VNDNDRSEYERRLREDHPEQLWWENLRDHKILVALIALAVLAMVVVGFVVN
jgi:hypothetical protein